MWKKLLTAITNAVNYIFKKRDRDILLQKTIEDLLKTHGIQVSGISFYNQGKKFSNKPEADEYITQVIKPLFISLNQTFLNFVDDRKYLLRYKLNAAEALDVHLGIELDENNQKSYLFELMQDISISRQKEEQIERNSFPDVQMREVVSNGFNKYLENFEKFTMNDKTDEEVLKLAVKQNEVERFVEAKLINIKNEISILQNVKPSLIFPPQRKFIFLFYFFSFILTIAEAGFSFPIINDMMNITILPGSSVLLNFIFSILYSVGISISIAVIIKKLIDIFLFKNRNAYIFWILYAMMFFIMFVLFSNKFGIIKSFIASFFLVLFALANAFSFREAVYLHSLFRNIYNKNNIQRIKRCMVKYKQKVKKRRIKNETLMFRLRENLALFSNEALQRAEVILQNLESISIGKFWQGYDDGLLERIETKKDILIGIKNQLKRLL